MGAIMSSEKPILGTQSAEKPYVRSQLESLPTELRQEIYSYLGFPIGNIIWTPCTKGQRCTQRSHYRPHEDDGNWQITIHDMTLAEVKTSINQIELGAGTGLESSLKSLKFWCNETSRWEPMPLSRVLMGVNRFFRDELLSLLFGNVSVQIGYTLIEQMICRRPTPNWLSSFPHRETYPPYYDYLRYMTSITLPKRTDKYLINKEFRKSAKLDAQTIAYFRKHCSHLAKLTYSPHTVIENAWFGEPIHTVMQALGKLARKRPSFKRLGLSHRQQVLRTNAGTGKSESFWRDHTYELEIAEGNPSAREVQVKQWVLRIFKTMASNAEKPYEIDD
ncbi:hypothetical protein BDV96DRAFT_266956 [Lophiotrema nucula]|uniref:Uncharacterized protein n=1 Tax=Lophiotrema nucula TaxID=690887 RepID=A0A6A5ZLF4_9PLEO|nr:hypothetical protein BDV96DRAFT_266956 [Lophiotrema nucula]